MIEREASVRIYSEILANTLGAKVAKGRLVRVAPTGFYEVLLEASGKNYTTPAAHPVHGDHGGGARRRRRRRPSRCER